MSEKNDEKMGLFVAIGIAAAVAAILMMLVTERCNSARSDMKRLNVEVEELKKFEADTKVMLPAVVGKMQGLQSNQELLLNDVRNATSRQEAEMVVMGRVMSNREGSKHWKKMVEEARSELQAEVDEAKKAQEQLKK